MILGYNCAFVIHSSLFERRPENEISNLNGKFGLFLKKTFDILLWKKVKKIKKVNLKVKEV